MTASPLLLIEDTPSLQVLYRTVLQNAGYSVEVAGDGATGLAAFRRISPDVVLLDIMLPDRDGLSLMTDILAERPGARVVVITSNGSINKAVEAMRAGAHDFLVKPFDDNRLLNAITNALRVAGIGTTAPRRKPEALTGSQFIGSSPALREVHGTILSVSRSMASVFITGESGTGKELAAQAVHDLSPRAKGPFIALNCGAIPPDLLESEVFGHVRGAFTGAVTDKPGAAVTADGGTLFLDEICEMDPALQPKLLRFLQTSTVTPVGSSRPRKVDVRIVCATNRDPLDEVRRGRFREDLYYRLYVVPVHMPPLRARGNDVIEIAETALARFAAEEGRVLRRLSDEVRDLFRHLPWPGNVRQLLNVMRNVAVLHDGPEVTLAMLPADLARTRAPAPQPGPPVVTTATPVLEELLAGRTLAEIERLMIAGAVRRHGGSVPRAARELGVAPSTLYRKRDEKPDS